VIAKNLCRNARFYADVKPARFFHDNKTWTFPKSVVFAVLSKYEPTLNRSSDMLPRPHVHHTERDSVAIKLVFRRCQVRISVGKTSVLGRCHDRLLPQIIFSSSLDTTVRNSERVVKQPIKMMFTKHVTPSSASVTESVLLIRE
jgi:hypothetical protein